MVKDNLFMMMEESTLASLRIIGKVEKELCTIKMDIHMKENLIKIKNKVRAFYLK